LSESRTITIPVTYNYHMDRIYPIEAEQALHLARLGLFPECFEASDDLAKDWMEKHNDELCDIIDARQLPYRPLTPEEEKHDIEVKAGRLKEPMIRPVGPDQVQKKKLQRLVRKVPKDPDSPVAQTETAAEAPRGRKPMSAEARAAAGERLKAARAAKKQKAAV